MTMYREENGVQVLCTPEEEATITAEWEAEDTKKAANVWHDNRSAAYPKLSDQVDIILAQFQALSTVITLTPQMHELITYVQSVKTNNPKPT